MLKLKPKKVQQLSQNHIKSKEWEWDAWVAQSVGHLTLDFGSGLISGLHIEPASGSSSAESLLEILSLSPRVSLAPHSLILNLSL